MILGRDRCGQAACFDELDLAVETLRQEQGESRAVCLNAHLYPSEIPPHAVVYNLENIGVHVHPETFHANQVLWDFSRRNVDIWKKTKSDVTHVPIGYHPSMERFVKRPMSERDVDVVFTGTAHPRRERVLAKLREQGLRVDHVPLDIYGAERNARMARARMALNILYYETGIHPVLRSAHCVANKIPILSETAPEAPEWGLLYASYDDLARRCVECLQRGDEYLENIAEAAHFAFRAHPLRLPSASRGPE